MSEATVSATFHAGRVSSYFGGITKRVSQYRVYRNTLAELQMLGDRELADLGLNRSVLRSVAYKSAYEN